VRTLSRVSCRRRGCFYVFPAAGVAVVWFGAVGLTAPRPRTFHAPALLVHHRAMLRSELVRLLQKLSEVHSTKKDRTAFLINNVNAIITVLQEVRVLCPVILRRPCGRGTAPRATPLTHMLSHAHTLTHTHLAPLTLPTPYPIPTSPVKASPLLTTPSSSLQRHVSADDIAVYEDLLGRQTAVFVEEELGSHFQPLIAFVRSTESDMHAMAAAAGGGRAGGGAGAAAAPAAAGGRAEATHSKLPEGVVPRLDHAVAVRVGGGGMVVCVGVKGC
jgi:hypothetical protein